MNEQAAVEEVVMAQIIRRDDGVTLVVNPDDENDLIVREIKVGGKKVMGEVDQEAFPYEVIISVVPRPIGGTWRSYPKQEWPS